LWTLGNLPNDAYIGMELDGERGQYHFNARSYDPKLSRFFAPDLLFEMYPNQSPYAYSANNPVNFKDPSGMSPEYFGSSESQVVIAAPNGIDENRAAWESGRFGEMSGYMALGIRSCGLGFGSVGSVGATIRGAVITPGGLPTTMGYGNKLFGHLFNVSGFDSEQLNLLENEFEKNNTNWIWI